MSGDGESKKSVENFMKAYYHTAREIYRSLKLELARFQWHNNWRKVTRRTMGKELVGLGKTLYFRHDPGTSGFFPSGDDLIEIFLEASRKNFSVSEQLIGAMRKFIDQAAAPLLFTTAGHAAFLKLLQKPLHIP